MDIARCPQKWVSTLPFKFMQKNTHGHFSISIRKEVEGAVKDPSSVHLIYIRPFAGKRKMGVVERSGRITIYGKSFIAKAIRLKK